MNWVPKIGDKIQTRILVINIETLETMPISLAGTVLEVKQLDQALTRMGFGYYGIKTTLDPMNFHFAVSFELIKKVGFVIE